MSDNVLKKEFNKKDVTRMRNIMKGQAGERTTDGVGYSKKEQVTHVEGDIWEEGGRTWTIKDGIRQNVTKLDSARKAIHLPLFCPECKSKMTPRIDKAAYTDFKRCFNCFTEMRGKMKREGTWEQFQIERHNTQIEQLREEYLAWVDDMRAKTNDGIVSEAGEVQNWSGGLNNDLVEQSIKETLEYFDSLKKA